MYRCSIVGGIHFAPGTVNLKAAENTFVDDDHVPGWHVDPNQTEEP